MTKLNLAIFLFASLFSTLVFAKGPGDKATGNYTVQINGLSYYADIAAHEATDKQPAKGHFHWQGTRNGQQYIIDGKVTKAVISGNTADIWVEVTSVTNATHVLPGWRFRYQLVDRGTPGRNGDTMELWWLSGTRVHWGPVAVTSGNLSVHSQP